MFDRLLLLILVLLIFWIKIKHIKTFNKVSESPALNLSALGDYVRDFDEHFNDKMNNLNNI